MKENLLERFTKMIQKAFDDMVESSGNHPSELFKFNFPHIDFPHPFVGEKTSFLEVSRKYAEKFIEDGYTSSESVSFEAYQFRVNGKVEYSILIFTPQDHLIKVKASGGQKRVNWVRRLNDAGVGYRQSHRGIIEIGRTDFTRVLGISPEHYLYEDSAGKKSSDEEIYDALLNAIEPPENRQYKLIHSIVDISLLNDLSQSDRNEEFRQSSLTFAESLRCFLEDAGKRKERIVYAYIQAYKEPLNSNSTKYYVNFYSDEKV